VLLRVIKSAFLFIITLFLLFVSACHKPKTESDIPRLTSNTTLRDITFKSAALGRETQYRVILPVHIPFGTVPAVYLLHGGDGNFRNWSNYSDVAVFAERDLILVMPDGDESYYTNAVARPYDRYEDYIVKDLIAEVESRFAAVDRSKRAIIGVSMGGFGAVKLALKHPELFAFVGGLSSALDVPSRPFSIKRIGQWRHYRSIFGPWNGSTQQANDPYILVGSADPARVPYMYMTCGDQEGLIAANRRFGTLLGKRHFAYELHVVPGGHNWTQWNQQLPKLFQNLRQHLKTPP